MNGAGSLTALSTDEVSEQRTTELEQGPMANLNGHEGGNAGDSQGTPKGPSKGAEPAAEGMEGRGWAKGNAGLQNTPRAQDRQGVPSARDRIGQAARMDKGRRFTTLLHHVYNIETLREAYFSLKREAAPGVDGETWQSYGEQLESNLKDLSARLRRGAYRAKPVRRVFIPKPDGRLRPLGVTTLEDKLVQRALVMVLSCIYEVDFLGFSYGFRPGRRSHDALDALCLGIERKKVNWVLDADIRGFFDAIDHELLVKFIEQRVADRRVVRLIQKWLNAGVLVDGEWMRSERGTPQGGGITPRTQKVTSSSSVWSRGGVRRLCLTCVVRDNMFMSREPGDQGRQGAVSERGLPPAPPANGGRGGRTAARAQVCAVATASLPLPRAGQRIERSSRGGGADGRRHVQATGEHGARPAGVRSAQRAHPRADRHTGACGASWRLTPAWLSGGPFAARCGFSSPLHLIGYRPASWPKRTRFWYRPEHARSSHM